MTVRLPRFRVSGEAAVEEALKGGLGVTDLFDRSRADLRLMTDKEGIVLSSVAHRWVNAAAVQYCSSSNNSSNNNRSRRGNSNNSKLPISVFVFFKAFSYIDSFPIIATCKSVNVFMYSTSSLHFR